MATPEATERLYKTLTQKMRTCEPNIPRHVLYADLGHLLLRHLTEGSTATGFDPSTQPLMKTALRAPTIFREILREIKDLKLAPKAEDAFLSRFLIFIGRRMRDHFKLRLDAAKNPEITAA